MLEIPKHGDEYSQYDGSRLFTWLADFCGLSVDLVNFLLSQVFALFLASLFRSLLHPSKVSSGVRHAFGLFIGLFFGYFCFGQQAIHIAGLPTLCYIVIRTQNPQIVQRMVMMVSMIYLSCVHLHRLYYDYGSSTLDITGPLMIITQKVTSLAFSIHDGFSRDENELSESQQYHAVRKLPSALEYFAYVFHFQCLLAGPLVFYRDYMEFIEGYQILKHAPSSNGNIDKNLSRNEIIVEPSPIRTVITKVIQSIICVIIFMKFMAIYPIKGIKDNDFVENTTFVYKFWYLMIATTVVRFKYYHAWLLADAICNNSGLGFNGFDEMGRAKWDLVSNINVMSFEFATNMRNAINSWNLGTNLWLRSVVYERVPKKYGTLFTFCLSAIWHGFYPGYYLTFTSGAIAVVAARIGRKLFRHRFQETNSMQLLYDILTLLTTRLFMCYLTFPFVLLEFKASLNVYLKLFMCLHLVLLFTIFVLPKFVHGERTKSKTHTIKQTAAVAPASAASAEITTTTLTDNKFVENDGQTNENRFFCNDCDKNFQISIKATVAAAAVRMNCERTNNPILMNGVDHNINGGGPCTTLPSNKCDANVKMNNNINNGTGNGNTKNGDLHSINNSNIIGLKNRSSNRDFPQKLPIIGLTEYKNGDAKKREFCTPPSSPSSSMLGAGVAAGLRKRHFVHFDGNGDLTVTMNGNNVDAFIKQEIDAIHAAVHQTNILPAVVLTNGHLK